MKYKVIEVKSNIGSLEEALNHYSKEGWNVKTVTRTPGSECAFTVVLEK